MQEADAGGGCRRRGRRRRREEETRERNRTFTRGEEKFRNSLGRLAYYLFGRDFGRSGADLR